MTTFKELVRQYRMIQVQEWIKNNPGVNYELITDQDLKKNVKQYLKYYADALLEEAKNNLSL